MAHLSMDSFDSFRMWAADFPQVSSADAASSSDAKAPTLPPIAVPAGAVAEAAVSAEEVQRAEIHFGRLALTNNGAFKMCKLLSKYNEFGLTMVLCIIIIQLPSGYLT